MKVVRGYKCIVCGTVYPVRAHKSVHKQWEKDGRPICGDKCYVEYMKDRSKYE